jgi:hypothetical protein
VRTAAANDEIHQIVFSWSMRSLLGDAGVGPVAASVGSGELSYWHDTLRAFASMVDSDHRPRPPWSLCYLGFGQDAAIVRRSRGLDALSRSDVAHVLIGPATELTARLCLGTVNWPSWIDRVAELGGRLPTVRLGELQAAWRTSAPGIDRAARRSVEALRPILAAALAHPGAPLTVVGPDHWPDHWPDDWPGGGTGDGASGRAGDGMGVGTDPLPLVQALVDILEPLYVTAAPPWLWTFSTYETRHDAARPGLPNLLFLPSLPQTPPSAGRRVVDLRSEGTGDVDRNGEPLLRVVDELLGVYAEAGREEVCELLVRRGALLSPTLPERIRALLASPSRRSPPTHGALAGSEPADPREDDPPGHAQAYETMTRSADTGLAETRLADPATPVRDALTLFEALVEQGETAGAYQALGRRWVAENAEQAVRELRRGHPAGKRRGEEPGRGRPGQAPLPIRGFAWAGYLLAMMLASGALVLLAGIGGHVR